MRNGKTLLDASARSNTSKNQQRFHIGPETAFSRRLRSSSKVNVKILQREFFGLVWKPYLASAIREVSPNIPEPLAGRPAIMVAGLETSPRGREISQPAWLTCSDWRPHRICR